MKTAYQGNMEKCAIAKGGNFSISPKVSYEIGNMLRGKNSLKAVAFLERVISMEEAVPYKRFNSDVGHRKGNMASGRYPIKAAKVFLALLKSAISNAIDKGLNEEALKVIHVCANKGAGQWHYGRQRRRQMKSTNLEIVVMETEAPKKTVKKTDVKAEPKVEAKPKTETKKEDVEAKPKETTTEKDAEKTEKASESKK
ncbi:MAG: 50S ribosomal protein L22 [Thermotogota bacterium]